MHPFDYLLIGPEFRPGIGAEILLDPRTYAKIG